MLNRETGAKPVLSRSCNAEQALKCHWVKTGKASDEAEPEELPDLDARNILRQTELRKPKGIIAPACLFADRRFVLRQKESSTSF